MSEKDPRDEAIACLERAYEIVGALAAEQPAGDEEGDGWLVALLAELHRTKSAVRRIK